MNLYSNQKMQSRPLLYLEEYTARGSPLAVRSVTLNCLGTLPMVGIL